ncbi:DUF4190 domain-containing protein [Subtercola sp. PAMC28395]|uniref:DUF4190 domain-containing protein n=1 Tax=Subtercola sp. PAMC28395 TaxID=2846775 RepID=UPI001C0B9029|nr:DUF4190 domain-containing protein [Subtercola sp. PAMC28395]QWT23584.1 DUF4190 domain-containing protein [Subtercola sp. PAMC28395]
MSLEIEPEDGRSPSMLPPSASTIDPRYLPPPQLAPTPQTNLFATLALVGFFVGGVIPGLILGHIALSQIKRTPQLGRGRALAAVTLSYCVLGMVVIVLTLSVLAGRR